jgi:dienelactone hydrolase
MLRIAAAVAAMALGWATLELRSLIDVNTSAADPGPVRRAEAHLPFVRNPDPVRTDPVRTTTIVEAPRVDTDGGVPRTARALEAALAKHGLVEQGRAWLGKLDGVGGGRDTLVFVPDHLDASRTVELVVYMEGHGSFADDAMDHRHASSIARLVARGGNVAYVAPDAPSSAHGNRTAKTPYWVPGCAERRCAGGHSAPGDFVVFLDEAVGKVAELAGADAGALDVRLHLVGFSNGGKGVWGAAKQLEDTDVAVSEVVFADANYGSAWLDETWKVLEPRGASMTILVGADPASGNRRRAAAFLRATPESPRIRLVPLRAGHHAIGDAAVDFLGGTGQIDVLAGS